MRNYKRGTGINKAFEITSVCKADILGLIQEGKTNSFTKTDILKLTESDMKHIASKMADAYCDNGFWVDLEIIVDNVLNKKKNG